MIIDTSYFYGPLSIAQLNQEAVREAVEYFINEYEPRFLEALMGYELYKAYRTGIAAGSPAQKWLDIRDGKEYTNDSDVLVNWPGLVRVVVAPVEYDAGPPEVQAVAGQYKSPIANYVYFHYHRNTETATTGTGEKSLNAQNAESASMRMKLARAWNEMVTMNWQLVDFLQYYDDVYPEFTDYYGAWDQTDLLTKINPLI